PTPGEWGGHIRILLPEQVESSISGHRKIPVTLRIQAWKVDESAECSLTVLWSHTPLLTVGQRLIDFTVPSDCHPEEVSFVEVKLGYRPVRTFPVYLDGSRSTTQRPQYLVTSLSDTLCGYDRAAVLWDNQVAINCIGYTNYGTWKM